jgi:hypothetical protein
MPDIFTASSKKTTKSTNKFGITDTAHKIITGEIPKRPLGLFSHYFPNPDGVSFIDQEDDEHIVLFIRKHFITNFLWIISTILLLLLPPLVIVLFRITDFSLFTLPQSLIIILVAFYYLVIFNYALVNFIIWFYHIGIVTQKRLLDLDVYNILNHHLAETGIAEIVDVSYSQRGFFQSFFNYGDIPIQTEAIKANFEFELAPKPAIISDIITDLRAIIKGES